ncbi:MAG: hypothetical protein AAGG02_16265 [Cyanobacteria bacterium P01_H01_bin.15]
MKHFADDWVKEWCDLNGWTDLIIEPNNMYWAFPPGAFMPEPVPSKVLRSIKATKGLSRAERWWSWSAVFVALAGLGSCFWTHSPMPLVVAFCFCAIAVAKLEVEDM